MTKWQMRIPVIPDRSSNRRPKRSMQYKAAMFATSCRANMMDVISNASSDDCATLVELVMCSVQARGSYQVEAPEALEVVNTGLRLLLVHGILNIFESLV